MNRIYEKHAGELRRSLAYQELYLPAPAPAVVADRGALYELAAQVIGPDELITYLEFGVASGGSIATMAQKFRNPKSIFIGFDSFEGLPEDWVMHKRGAFSQNGNIPVIQDDRVRFVKGWFQNTFYESLSWIEPHLSGHVLIHFDADLYSSTLFLLSSLWAHCRNYYFIMDDFMVDDIIALHDFSLSFPVKINFIARRDGGLPHSVFGKISRKVFAIT